MYNDCLFPFSVKLNPIRFFLLLFNFIFNM
jgi:hypothetical protein